MHDTNVKNYSKKFSVSLPASNLVGVGLVGWELLRSVGREWQNAWCFQLVSWMRIKRTECNLQLIQPIYL